MSTASTSRYLYISIGASFQGVNWLFALSFENENDWKSYKWYYPPTVQIKDYNAIIDGRFFDHPVKQMI